jgi:Metallo-peptidase family M12/Divergent InlB B-repeat domain
MYQTVSIPANATSASLSLWYRITTTETSSTTSFDVLNITIQDQNGNFLASVATLSNLSANTSYSQVTKDLTSFAGRTIRLNFLGTTDSSLPTVFRVDDVSLTVVTQQAPAAPSGLQAVGSANNVLMQWADNSSNESGFKIDRKLGPSGSYSPWNQFPANSTTAQDSGLSYGTVYCYRVYAFNGSGNSGFSNESCATTLAVPVLTSPADGGTSTSSSVTLQWGAVTGADGYGVNMGSSCGGTNVVNSQATASPSLQVSNVPDGTYYWQVRAFSSTYTGLSSYSSCRSLIVSTQGPLPTASWTTPPPSSIMSGQAFSVSFTTTGNPTHVNIHWDPTDPGTPANPEGNINPTCVPSSVSCSTTSPTSSPASLTAPTVTTQTVVKYEVHVSKNGTNDAFSSIVPVTVNVAGAGPNIRIDPLSLQFSSSPQALLTDSDRRSRLDPEAHTSAAAVEISALAGDFTVERAMRTIDRGGRVNLTGILLEGETDTSTLELQRFEVWRPDAVVMVGGRRVPPPKTLYFRGSVEGHPGSSVLLSIRETGEVMGLALRADGGWAIGKSAGEGRLRSRKADLTSVNRSFSCNLDSAAYQPVLPRDEAQIASLLRSGVTGFSQPYVATIAVETDYEYYAEFLSKPDPLAAALDYMADLMGYASLIYAREIHTDLTIGFARLWTDGATTDPWNATTDKTAALNEFVAYWNTNEKSVKRTASLLLSGKRLNGGLAVTIGALCDNFSHPGNSQDYAIAGDLDANFAWSGNQAQNPAAVVFDIYVVSHELGHLFNSPHTHQYCNIGGSPNPIDQCADGCAGVATGLPSCSSPTPLFNGGPGTIMSWCHVQPGWVSNIALTFGEGHTCGTLPSREGDLMGGYVAAQASTFPGCFAGSGIAFTIYNDGAGALAVNSLALETPAPWITWLPAPPYSVPGGGTQVVTVSVDYSLAPPGPSARRILISSNDPDPKKSPYPGGVNVIVNRQTTAPCYSLSLTHTGVGTNPSPTPMSSAGCSAGQYTAGASIQLTASPAAGWSVGSWTGTSNDSSTSASNIVGMPASNSTVTVNYVQVPPPCYSLGTSANPSTGGGVSLLTPQNCSNGYTPGTAISVSATPNAGFAFSSWSGTGGSFSGASASTTFSISANASVTANFASPLPSGSLNYFTVPPCRAVDTRNPVGPLGGPALAPTSQRTLPLAGVCGIPPSARAVSVNITVTGTTAAGDLRFYPGDGAIPSTSTINFGAGQTRANNAVLELSQDGSGALGVRADSSGSLQVIVDVNGYFEEPTAP